MLTIKMALITCMYAGMGYMCAWNGAHGSLLIIGNGFGF